MNTIVSSTTSSNLNSVFTGSQSTTNTVSCSNDFTSLNMYAKFHVCEREKRLYEAAYNSVVEYFNSLGNWYKFIAQEQSDNLHEYVTDTVTDVLGYVLTKILPWEYGKDTHRPFGYNKAGLMKFIPAEFDTYVWEQVVATLGKEVKDWADTCIKDLVCPVSVRRININQNILADLELSANRDAKAGTKQIAFKVIEGNTVSYGVASTVRECDYSSKYYVGDSSYVDQICDSLEFNGAEPIHFMSANILDDFRDAAQEEQYEAEYEAAEKDFLQRYPIMQTVSVTTVVNITSTVAASSVSSVAFTASEPEEEELETEDEVSTESTQSSSDELFARLESSPVIPQNTDFEDEEEYLDHLFDESCKEYPEYDLSDEEDDCIW